MSEIANIGERDSESRRRIIEDINENFIVEASAGSGKTTMLVNRMVAMVEAGIPIAKICAITFTKAAANEFYERFQKLLIDRSNADTKWEDKGYAGQLKKPDDNTKRLCEQALENIDLCFMGTIDSFCRMVISEHPAKAGIPSDADLISKIDEETLYMQQYIKMCSGEYGEKLEALSKAFRLFYSDAEKVFAGMFPVFMKSRNVHFNLPANTKLKTVDHVDIDSDFSVEKEKLLRMVEFLLDHPELKYDGNAASRDAWTDLKTYYKRIQKSWSTYFERVQDSIDKIGGLCLIPEALANYSAKLGDFFVLSTSGKIAQCTISKDNGLVSKLDSYKFFVVMTFMDEAVKVVENVMREKGYMSYFDYLYYLRNMLRADAKDGDGKLIRHIANRHKYYLIDEFQDTDSLQSEIFFYLSSDDPKERWVDCVPRKGSLFIVGDPKQSIYRFRGADVSSFLKVKNLFDENNILVLSRNFRSKRSLCEYFNRVFTPLMENETEHQSKFEIIEPLPDPTPDAEDDPINGEFQGVYKYGACVAALGNLYPERTDPKQITSIIERLVDCDEFKITTKEDKTPRKIRYDDIMIITDRKKMIAPIMSSLNKAGIATRVEGAVPFYSNEALIEVVNIYSALADGRNRIAMYKAITGKLLGLTEDEYQRYREYRRSNKIVGSIDIDSCDDETVCLVAEKYNKIAELRQKTKSYSPASLFEKIMDEFQVYNYVQAEELEVIYYTLELLRNAEQSGIIISIKDGAVYLEKLVSTEDDDVNEERCLSLNENIDAVHIANLHKVKGLEAPIVILAAYYWRPDPTKADRSIVHGDDSTEGYLFKFNIKLADGNYKDYLINDSFPDAKQRERAAIMAEFDRFIYVAATRARNALIICESYGKRVQNIVPNSYWRPILEQDTPEFIAIYGRKDDIEDGVSGAVEEVSSKELYEEAENSCVLNNRGMEDETYILKTPSRDKLESKTSGDTSGEGELISVEIAGSGGEVGDTAVTGTVSSVADAETSEAGGSSLGNTVLHSFPDVLGTMTHKLLEMLVSSRGTIEVSNAVNETINEFMKPSIEVYRDKLVAALTEVAETMKKGGYPQTNGLPQDMLTTLLEADEVYAEVPFSCAIYEEVETEDGSGTKKVKTLWNGIMDIIYRKDEKWHIVDWKTNKEGENLDVKYASQMEAYKTAFRTIFEDDPDVDTDVDAHTYHIDI